MSTIQFMSSLSMAELFFDPDYSPATVKRIERQMNMNRKQLGYLQNICADLEQQLVRDPAKTCAVRFEAIISHYKAERSEPLWCLTLAVCERVQGFIFTFDIKLYFGRENTIRQKAADIRGQLSEQLRQPGVEALIFERGFDGSLADIRQK